MRKLGYFQTLVTNYLILLQSKTYPIDMKIIFLLYIIITDKKIFSNRAVSQKIQEIRDFNLLNL